MRRNVFLVIVMMMVMAFAGCSESPNEITEPVKETTVETETVAKVKTIDILPDPEDYFSEGNVAIIDTYYKEVCIQK